MRLRCNLIRGNGLGLAKRLLTHPGGDTVKLFPRGLGLYNGSNDDRRRGVPMILIAGGQESRYRHAAKGKVVLKAAAKVVCLVQQSLHSARQQ